MEIRLVFWKGQVLQSIRKKRMHALRECLVRLVEQGHRVVSGYNSFFLRWQKII